MSHRSEGEALPQRQFDEYLEGRSEVSYRYRQLGICAAPRALDDRVMQQADQHLAQQQSGRQCAQSSEPRSAMRSKWLRWGTSLAVAATLLLGVAVQLDSRVRRGMEPAASAPAAVSVSAPTALVTDAPERGVKTESQHAEPDSFRAELVRDDQFFFGRREPSTGATPYRSSSALVLGSTNADRGRSYLQVPPVTASASGAAAPARQSETRAESGAATLDEDRRVTPEAWVERIRRARAQGDSAQVATFLERLRAAHPGFALPADISPQR